MSSMHVLRTAVSRSREHSFPSSSILPHARKHTWFVDIALTGGVARWPRLRGAQAVKTVGASSRRGEVQRPVRPLPGPSALPTRMGVHCFFANFAHGGEYPLGRSRKLQAAWVYIHIDGLKTYDIFILIYWLMCEPDCIHTRTTLCSDSIWSDTIRLHYITLRCTALFCAALHHTATHHKHDIYHNMCCE